MNLHSSLANHARSALAANDGMADFSPAPIVQGSRRDGGRSHFEVYRAERVGFTSTLFGGGDWHWRLTGSSGAVLADCGGYPSKRACIDAVEALRTEAVSATLSQPGDLRI
jgi:uncharacterized protein YegP (UPF0339 family)